MIGLSETAAVKVRELISKRPGETQGLRVGARCGVRIHLLPRIRRSTQSRDRELDSHGVKLFVDPKSYLYLMVRSRLRRQSFWRRV